MNPTLDLINTKAQLLSKLGFTNSKQEIIWYLEQLDLLTMEQLYTNNIILKTGKANYLARYSYLILFSKYSFII